MALGDYSPTAWVNGTAPAISASNLLNIENKVAELDNYAGKGGPPLVRAEYTIDTQTPTNSPKIIQASTKVEDTHSAVTTGASWKFTAPISGLYLFSFAADASVSQAANWYVNFYLCKNGTGIPGLIISKLNPGLNVGCDTGGSRVIRLNQGDYVDLRWTSGATLTANISGGTIQITRIGS